MNRRHVPLSAMLCAMLFAGPLLALPGCTKPLRQLHPTEGTVTFQGAPVIGAQVVFHNQTEAITLPVLTDENGKYVVKMADGNGLPAGEYAVSVRPYKPPPRWPGGGGAEPLQLPPGTPSGDTRKDVPPRYAGGLLKFTVEAGKTNTFDIQLEP